MVENIGFTKELAAIAISHQGFGIDVSALFFHPALTAPPFALTLFCFPPRIDPNSPFGTTMFSNTCTRSFDIVVCLLIHYTRLCQP